MSPHGVCVWPFSEAVIGCPAESSVIVYVTVVNPVT